MTVVVATLQRAVCNVATTTVMRPFSAHPTDPPSSAHPLGAEIMRGLMGGVEYNVAGGAI